MAHPVVWYRKSFFYPIGNTPPVCLTQNLSPETQAEILLLGSGDPRSILYTIHTDLNIDGRHLDFTCCDWEPAVLARNILLLTMISDGVPPSDTWPIFYHLFLDEPSHSILLARCRTLVQSSVDLKTWNASKYGAFLRFCTDHSLTEIRRHWSLYLESKDVSEQEALKKSFISKMRSTRERWGKGVLNTMRSAGPLFLSLGWKAATESYDWFWSTGVTPSKLHTSQSGFPPHINPTFAHSSAGQMFNVHYGTDPLQSFYFAPALALKKDATTIEDLAESAREQFAAWCESFKRHVPSRNVIIRFFVGESLSFCRALNIAKNTGVASTGVYVDSWGISQITLCAEDYGLSSTTPAPLSFNIIETSNLTDHVGLVNMLVATLPLLRREPWSIIHTNTLLRKTSSEAVTSGINDAACGDVPTLAILLGIAPSSRIWHFATHCDKQEILTFGILPGSKTLHENVTWRFLSSALPNASAAEPTRHLKQFRVACQEKKLSEFFLSLYLRMFEDENISRNMRNMNISAADQMSVVHYVRASFVALLALVKDNVNVDWTDTMDHLVDLIELDRSLLMGSNNYQDMICQLFLKNVHTMDVFLPVFIESRRTRQDRFYGWRNVPPVVCVVLKVPRKQLKIIEDMKVDNLPTPILQCQSLSRMAHFHNIHSSIQLCFGDVDVQNSDGEPQVTIHEDHWGWSGNSPLIVSFYMPSWILTNAPTSTDIGLHVRNTPATVSLMSKLGMHLTIYSTSLTDTANIQVVRHRPQNTEELEHSRRTLLPVTQSSLDSREQVDAQFDSSGQRITSLIVREGVKDKAAQALANGSKVSTEPIGDSTFSIKLDSIAYKRSYPCPVHIHRLKTRIARKSSYIEVEALLRSDFSDFFDLSLDPFPVAKGDKSVTLLNIHYLNLDSLPTLELPASAKQLDWFPIHAGMMFSEAEKEAKQNPDADKRGTLVNLKESIGCILLNYAGLQLQSPDAWTNVFALCNPNDVGIYTLIFVNGIKFDLSNHTVVVDACVVPLIDKIMDKLRGALQDLIGKITQVVTLKDKVHAWKRLLPTLAERCRTWKHTEACEYRKKGVPVAQEGSTDSPLCSCGKGKNLGHFGTVSKWKAFREHTTRVAIGPLFTFSFMEEAIKRMEMHGLRSAGTSSSSTSVSKCAKCGGPGKPTLRTCSVCKKIQYCSRECQKSHWKVHKKNCATNA